MNILGIGAPELILIFMIAIVVAGPKRMIRWAFLLGQYVGKLRAMWADVAKVIQAEVDAAGLDVQVPKDIPTKADVGRMIEQAAKPLADPINKAAQEVDQDMRRAQSSVSDSVKIPPTTDGAKAASQPSVTSPNPTPAPAPNDLGTWSSPATQSSANGVKTATPDLGTWGAHSDSDLADRP